MDKAEWRRIAVFSFLAVFSAVALAWDPHQPWLTIWAVAIIVDLTVVGLTVFRQRP